MDTMASMVVKVWSLLQYFSAVQCSSFTEYKAISIIHDKSKAWPKLEISLNSEGTTEKYCRCDHSLRTMSMNDLKVLMHQNF